MPDQRVVSFLLDWAEWMGGYNPAIGFNKRVPLIATGGGSPTFEELLSHVDGHIMKTIDASVSSLEPLPRAAIYRHYDVCAVWRFPRNNFQEVLEDAHQQIEIILRRKSVLT